MWLAATVSAWLEDVLVEGAAGHVHSVFDRAVNLLVEGRLVALQDAGMGMAPYAIAVAPPPGGFRRWRPGDAVRVQAGFLWVGDEALCLAAPRWDPAVPPPARRTDLRANAARLRRRLAAEGRSEGLLRPTLEEREPVAPLLQGNLGAARALVGLGAGLTPAGDDLLCGLLATLVTAGARARADRLAALVLPLRHKTTLVAAAMLEAAARGGLHERTGRLLHDLLSQDGEAAVAAAGAALRMGHSSGTDLCCGLYAGLMLLAKEGSG